MKVWLPYISIPSGTSTRRLIPAFSAWGVSDSSISASIPFRLSGSLEMFAAPSSMRVMSATSPMRCASRSVCASDCSRNFQCFSGGRLRWASTVSRHTLMEATGVLSSWFMLFVSCFLMRVFSCCSCMARQCSASRSAIVCCRRTYSLTIWLEMLPSSSCGNGSQSYMRSPFSALAAKRLRRVIVRPSRRVAKYPARLTHRVVPSMNHRNERSACRISWRERE